MHRLFHHYGWIRIGLDIPAGKLGLVYELLAEHGGRILARRKRRFTLAFEESESAEEFLSGLFGCRVRLQDYLV
jgi:hypothetical protein